MVDSRDVEFDARPQGTATERRWMERYLSAHDTVTIAGDTVRHTAVVLNTSLAGMGLGVASATGLAPGQIVTIDGVSGPVRAVVRHTTAVGEGAYHVGVEWCD